MQLLEQYVQTLFESQDLLQTWRKRAWDRFQEIGLPKFKQEAFQYVPLQHLAFPKAASAPIAIPQCPANYAHRIFFVDGFFQSASLPSSLICQPLNGAMKTYGIFLQNRFLRLLKEESDPFSALNGALHGCGAFLYVPPNVVIEEPIEIHHLFTSSSMGSPHLQVFLGKGSSVQLMQRASHEEALSFGNIRIDVSLDEGASLFLGDDQRWPKDSVHFQTIRSTLKRDSNFHFLSLSSGAKLSRSSIKVQLLEENSSALMQGLWRLDQELQSHTHIVVEHLAPHCRSRQHFKGVLKGQSRSSFEGKIFVAPQAQKTEAYQLNNNLLLSDEASANAKPNLEVFADDVKASHGATIAQLQEEELFYLCSRGLKREDAKEILTRGFCDEILAAAPRFFKEAL